MNWQPIETAPKDGKRVLLWAHATGFARDGREVQVGRYNVGWDEYWSGGSINYELITGWVADKEEDQGYGCEASLHPIALTPTHWMPLPEPPHDQGA